jgi:pimeloyl-ACP methyl ester carboxylesterase
MNRSDVTFKSGGADIAAWLYEPEGATGATPCVVMGHGFSLTRHDGLGPYAEAFAAAGVAALVFDHRHLGDSGGEPRQRFRVAEQVEDWRNAVAFARRLPGIDARRIALWAYSMAAGHAVRIASEDPGIAAALTLCPLVDGLPRVLGTPPGLVLWILPRALADALGRQNLIPVTGQPGEHAAMTLPGEADGFARAVGPGSPWRNEISPAIFATIAFHRPITRAAKVACPLWVGIGERDITVSPKAAAKLARKAPRGELHRYDADHFDPFVGDLPARIAADQVGFLQRSGFAARATANA